MQGSERWGWWGWGGGAIALLGGEGGELGARIQGSRRLSDQSIADSVECRWKTTQPYTASFSRNTTPRCQAFGLVFLHVLLQEIHMLTYWCVQVRHDCSGRCGMSLPLRKQPEGTALLAMLSPGCKGFLGDHSAYMSACERHLSTQAFRLPADG